MNVSEFVYIPSIVSLGLRKMECTKCESTELKAAEKTPYSQGALRFQCKECKATIGLIIV